MPKKDDTLLQGTSLTTRPLWQDELCEQIWSYIEKNAVKKPTMVSPKTKAQQFNSEEYIHQAFILLIISGEKLEALREHLSNITIPLTTNYCSEKFLLNTWNELMRQKQNGRLPAIKTKILESDSALSSAIKRGAQKICITAHGNGNARSDDSEARALNATFSNHAVPVTAFKWATGHTLAASGLIDVALTVTALQQRCLPGVANLQQPADNCANLNLSAQSRQLPPQSTALVINRGFASMNASVVMQSVCV